MKNRFFAESKEQSKVKSQILVKYFSTWAKVIIPTAKKHGNKIGFLDLFAGPGAYEDGTESTPIIVLQAAVQDSELSQMLVTIFNDIDKRNAALLQKAIRGIPNIAALRHQPRVYNDAVGKEMADIFREMNLIPSLIFFDPWGYKGLSLMLFGAVLKDWGCDCVFFFNYNRINMGITNDRIKEHIDALFGEKKATELRNILPKMTPMKRESTILAVLFQAFREMGYRYLLPFRFIDNKRHRTSHYLIFVTKNFKGYDIMKSIMAKQSSSHVQGVANFEHDPSKLGQPTLFEMSQPMNDLEVSLSDKFAGQTLMMQYIYETHCVGTAYVKSNYKDILKKMESEEKILVNPASNERMKDTFADNVMVTFPPKDQQ